MDQSDGAGQRLFHGVRGKMGRAIVEVVKFEAVESILRRQERAFDTVHVIAQLEDVVGDFTRHVALVRTEYLPVNVVNGFLCAELGTRQEGVVI